MSSSFMRSNASLTEQLADYWSKTTFTELPNAVVAMAKRVILDTLSVGVRGANSEVAQTTYRGACNDAETEHGSATIWGTPHALPARAAALVNGTAAHALEFDDYGGCGHSGAVVVPAVCAMAEKMKADGQTVLTAVVAGYDIAARVTEGAGGYRAHNDRGWHSTGTCGTFGAAAGVAKMMCLDRAQFVSALGVAGSYAGSTWAFLSDGAMTKRFHPGRAAENGLSAAVLAKTGLVGPRYILEAEWGGFYRTYSGSVCTPQATVAGLGDDFHILRTGLKPYPCCRGVHSSIDALLGLMKDENIGVDNIERMIVHGAERTVRQFENYDVQTLLDGQFSLPYVLATVADSGKATINEFDPLRTSSRRVRELMGRVAVIADRTLGPADEPELEVRGRTGEVWWRHVPAPVGSPAQPVSDSFVLHKSESTAAPVIGVDRARSLQEQIMMLEKVNDFSQISALLRPA